MKMNKIVFTAVLVAAVGFFACENPDTGTSTSTGSVFTLPDAPAPSSIQRFDSNATAVVSETEAIELLDAMGSTAFLGVLAQAKQDAFDAAFHDLNPTYADIDAYMATRDGEKSWTIVVPSINDTTALIAAADLAGTPNTINAATIKGSFTAKYTSNVEIGSTAPHAVGDTNTTTQISKITYSISDGFYTETVSSTTYEIAGVITVEVAMNQTKTLKTLAPPALNERYTTATTRTIKIAGTLSISDGTKGGIFSCALAMGGNQQARSVRGSQAEEAIISDVEVYNNSNAKIFTLDSDHNGLISAFSTLMLSVL